MEKLIFACPSEVNRPETIVFVSSIRHFGGSLSSNPVWILIPKNEKKISDNWKKRLEELHAEIIFFEPDKETTDFSFVRFVNAAAKAEEMARDKTELLAWLDANCLIVNEPKDFLLPKDKNLAYRPVHHTLIGSEFDKPLDSFWEVIYEKCSVPLNKVFPMRTHVDGKVLRPYINSGFLITRPERGFFAKWWKCYKQLYNEPIFDNYYKKSKLYEIFIHQAVLAGVLLNEMVKDEIEELSFNYNYPFHLYEESSEEYRYKDSSQLITARFYLDKLIRPKELENINIRDPLKTWLEGEIKYLKDNYFSPTKVKFGKIPLIYPIPMVLCGADVDGKANFELLGDVAVMGLNPPLLFISSGVAHHTNKGIIKNGSFSLNFPSTNLIAKMDYCGTVSGNDVDKSQLFDIFYGELKNAPMIKECPVNIEVKVLKEFSIQHRQAFIGEVVQTYVNEQFVEEVDDRKKIADMRLLDPVIYALDNKYYKIGEPIGVGYQESRELRKKE